MKTTHLHNPILLQKKTRWPDFRAALFLAACLLLCQTAVFAQLPAGFIAKKLTNNDIKEAVTMAHAPDGRIFIAERNGTLKQLKNGVVTTILTVSTTTSAEQGLLGIALHSSFSTNGKIYLYYTDPAITYHYLDVVVLSSTSAVLSQNRLMQFDRIINGYHNGGAMQFKDGLLYLNIGESNDAKTAQILTTYHGKVLRLQDDGQPAPGNPYYNTAGASRQQRSIWAIGMRNPWYMSMDPQTKKLYNINVGAGFEEINDITAPEASRNYNYGWGTDNRSGTDQDPNTTILPVFAYKRELPGWNAQTCAITSGLAFNPTNTNYPAQYRNRFYFTDWCTNWLRSLDLNNMNSGSWQEFANAGFARILGLSVGIDGNIYYSEYAGSGNIWRIEYTMNQSPQIVNHPQSKTIFAGETVTFSVSATGSNPLNYQWKKNGANISGATGATYTITGATNTHEGNYTVTVSNSIGSITSNAATLTINAANAAPVADITTPATSLTWAVDDLVNYAGTGTDAEDGVLPASAFNWDVRVYHKDCPTCEHWHPGPNAADGVKSGTFTAINGGETSSNIWLRVLLTVTDSKGRTAVDSVDIQPKKVNLTATSNYAGLQVVLGLANTTPYTKTAVVNAPMELQAPTPQVIGNATYTFQSWSHGGAANQTVRVPNANTTYHAIYTETVNNNVNLALNKPAFASTPADPANARQAVDGKTGTRWESVWNVENQWIYVDLGARYDVNRVKIIWEAAKASNYRIEVSDDINNWGSPVKSVTGNTTITNDWNAGNGLVAKTGRYVRMYGLTREMSNYGYSILEFEVYGTPDGGSSNLALNKPAFASTPADPANARLAVDGNASNTRWESAWQVDNQWIYVDLGARYNVSRVKITWENARATSYRVEVSDDINNWGTPVKSVSGNTTNTNDWTSANGLSTKAGRYVRIYGLTRALAAYGYSIYELEVYGSSAARSTLTDDVITEDVSLYPNPAFNDVTIKGSFTTTNNVNVTFINANGYVVFDADYNNTSGYFEARISVADLPIGTYVVKLICGDEVRTQKLIKE